MSFKDRLTMVFESVIYDDGDYVISNTPLLSYNPDELPDDDKFGDKEIYYLINKNTNNILARINGEFYRFNPKFLTHPTIIKWVKTSPELVYWYITAHARPKKWPEGEDTIKQDPQWAYYYAKFIIQGRFPACEPYMLKDNDLRWAYVYATEIMIGFEHQRWPEAEALFKTSELGMWENYKLKVEEILGQDIE